MVTVVKGNAWLDLTRYTAIRYQHTHDTFVFDIRCKVCEKMIGRKVDANNLADLKKVVDNHQALCEDKQSEMQSESAITPTGDSDNGK